MSDRRPSEHGEALEHVKQEVARIFEGDAKRPDHDPEALHVREDSLHLYVLARVAEGHPDARAMAVEALRTDSLGFSRWCG